MRIILIGVILMIATGAGYFYLHPSFQTPNTVVTATSAAEGSSARDVPEGFREYRHPFYRFSLLYPESLTVSEYSEPVTKLTLVFEEPGRAFQLHILPYGDAQITERRLALDIPSGVFVNPVDIVIDGVRGTMFESSEASLGTTREVWFIALGFLYEITTPIEHDAWLSEIMRTWQFVE